jgi:uncharacterized protein YoxC
MGKETEEVVLEFKIDKNDAVSELEKLKKVIVENKIEQASLAKEYKKGNITVQEYAKESVRLEGILKSNQSTYNNVQKSVTGVKTQLDKLIDSNKKISNDLQKTSKSFQDAASQINIAGVNVGSMTTKLAAFANPATAAVSIVGALGAVYARSTIGAKDLEFAQNQLNTAITIGSNAFASLFSSAEDGEGIVSKLTTGFLFQIDASTAALSKLAALNQEKFQDLGRSEIEVRSEISDRLAENQELLTKIADEQTTVNEKTKLGQQIVGNLRKNRSELTSVLKEELSILKDQLKIDKENEALQTAVLQKTREINKLNADTEKKIQGQQRANENIVSAEGKRITAERKLARDSGKSGLAGDTNTRSSLNGTDFLQDTGTKVRLDAERELNKGLDKLRKDNVRNETQQAGEGFRAFKSAQDAKLQAATIVSGALAGLADEGSDIQKVFALTSIGVDTARALTGGIAAAQDVPFPGNLVAMATTVAEILGNVAAAKQYFSAAAGGGDFITKGPAMLMVGDNPGGRERVTVEPLSGRGKTVVHPKSNLIAMAGGGSITTGDGGAVKNSMTQDANQALMMSNMIKRMPSPTIGVREFNKVAQRVLVKESTGL